jgi:signal transduction histidine kinase
VVCHEHVGPARKWTDRELEFASSVADMVALVFEQADRLELEAALQHQTEQRLEHQKVEALGRMACAVAHDFNNVLATIQLSLSLLADADDASTQKLMEEMCSMIEVGRRLTQQLLTFGRSGDDAPAAAAIDLRQVIARMEPMLRTAVSRSVALELQLSTQDARVVAVESQLEQVVLNLCLNARDAMQGRGGTITVRLREPCDADDVAPDCVVLEVCDTGVGMNEAVSARIFEPFFTTKQAGTGLGLAAVHGIVRRAGGVVRVQSKPGNGTTMLVALPRAPSP